MRTKYVWRSASVLAAMLLLVAGITSPAFARETALSATSSPIWQTNNTVRAVAYANGKVFVGGEFTTVRPPGAAAGSQETSRTYLAAMDAATGELLSFAPQPNGIIWALAASEDQSRVYVGGDFTQIAGQSRQRIAAFDTNTLSLISTFRPSVTYRVSTIAAQGANVYFGGSFGAVAGAVRNRLAAVEASNGALLPWNPNANADVKVVRPAPDGSKVYVGGKFDTLGGSPSWAVGLVDSTAGALLPFPAASAIPPKSSACVSTVRDIVVDQTTAYFANAGAGGGCFDGTFAADLTTGALKWRNGCLGATEALALVGGWLYKGSHAHNCSNDGGFPEGPNRYLLVQRPDNGQLAGWYPQTNAGGVTRVGPFAMATDGKQLWVGGDFTTVNRTGQQGMTRFQADPETPPVRPLTPSASSTKPGEVKVTFKATTDNDDENLTYNLYRSGTAEPILTQVVRSRFWDIPSVTFTDKNLTPGAQTAYRVEATDGVAVVQSYWTLYVTVASQPAGYPDTVKGDGASSFWRMEETGGTTAADSAGSNTGTYGSMNLGTPGILPGSSSAALQASNSNLTSSVLQSNPQTFSLETWIKTSTTSGGRILGFGNNRNTTSGNYDRHLYMRNDGKVVFGVWTGSAITVTSGAAINDGQWHHVVATMSPGRTELFVDGASQGINTPGAAQAYSGYWRAGADNLNGWPNQPASAAMVGNIDEVAIYPNSLSSSDVQWHYSLGKANQAPVASFSSECGGLNCGFDASASADVDGTITGYAWDFGDGQTGAGATSSHSYSKSGTYQVRLTVTDNLGATGTTTNALTVAAPNQAPAAVIATSCTGLTCSFDGSASSDPDGTLSGWAWDFGDGTTGAGETASHTYSKAGDYAVKLTVTDDKGTSSETAATLQVTPPAAGTVLAKDSFARTLAQGLGSADVGGPWTTTASASRYSVTGGAGNWIMQAPGNAPAAHLKNVVATDADLSFKVNLDKNATGGGVYLSAVARSVANQGEYRAKVRFTSTGRIYLGIVRTTATGAETNLTSETSIAGLSGTNGEQIGVRVQVTGKETAAIKAKVWLASGAEPAAWQLEVSDSTAGLQAPGYTGILTALSGSATNAPVTARISDYLLTSPR